MLCLKMMTWNVLSHFCWKRQNWQNKASKNIHLASIRSQFIKMGVTIQLEICCHVQSMQNKRRKRQTLSWSVLFSYVHKNVRHIRKCASSQFPPWQSWWEGDPSLTEHVMQHESEQVFKLWFTRHHLSTGSLWLVELTLWKWFKGKFYTNYLLYSKWLLVSWPPVCKVGVCCQSCPACVVPLCLGNAHDSL